MDDKIKNLINKGSEITGNISGTVLGLFLAGPVGAVAGAAVSPIMVDAFKKVGTELADKFLAHREEVRIGATFGLALIHVNKRLKSGDTPRNDQFVLKEEGSRSQAETILEGVLLKAKNEYEEKKLKYYSYFIANLSFAASIDFNGANTLLKIIDQLSYRQLCILTYVKKAETIDLTNWTRAFLQVEKVNMYRDFYYELNDLYQKQLLKEFNGISTTGPNNGKLTNLGLLLYELMNLEEIEKTDTDKIHEVFQDINRRRL